jgi:hypothetical protein
LSALALLCEQADILALRRVQEAVERPVELDDGVVATRCEFGELARRVARSRPRRRCEIRRHAGQPGDFTGR